MTVRPEPDLTIEETRVYRGANIWSYDRAIHLVVDLGVLEEFPTHLLPGFSDNLLGALPGLRRAFIRQAAGLTGELPKLLAGKAI